MASLLHNRRLPLIWWNKRILIFVETSRTVQASETQLKLRKQAVSTTFFSPAFDPSDQVIKDHSCALLPASKFAVSLGFTIVAVYFSHQSPTLVLSSYSFTSGTYFRGRYISLQLSLRLFAFFSHNLPSYTLLQARLTTELCFHYPCLRPASFIPSFLSLVLINLSISSQPHVLNGSHHGGQ